MPRGLDVVLSLTAMVALLPLLLVIAGLNYVLTGRVLFRQARIGRALRPFVILKFQTMGDDVDRESTITVDRDRRVGPFGRVLRSMKLDELPQLLNVLRGDMSLVGPRALTPNEVARIPQQTAERVYAVRPGLTGLASLMLTDEGKLLAGVPDPEAHYFSAILPQKAAWELAYVQNRSLRIDVLILVTTPLAILFPDAVRRLLSRVFNISPGVARAGEEHA